MDERDEWVVRANGKEHAEDAVNDHPHYMDDYVEDEHWVVKIEFGDDIQAVAAKLLEASHDSGVIAVEFDPRARISPSEINGLATEHGLHVRFPLES
jgi:hypothetical protein